MIIIRITSATDVSEGIPKVIAAKFCFPIFHQIYVKFRENNKMIKLKIILLNFLLNIFLSSQAYVNSPKVITSGNTIQREFNALMETKSSSKCFRKYLKKNFHLGYLQINNLQLSRFKRGNKKKLNFEESPKEI